jgi:DNA-binding response OmpR family regulator
MPLRHPRTPEWHEIATLDIKAPPLKPKQPPLRILLLDDRDDFREVLHEYLTSQGHHVVSVFSGVEGLQEIIKGRFDLIICDMMMPKMGGEMFYWAITRVRPGACQRIIFFSGHRNNRQIEAFYQRISATVLYKPFNLSQLDAKIKELLRKVA